MRPGAFPRKPRGVSDPASPPGRSALKASAPTDEVKREPILAAMRELLAGFENADQEAGGAILGDLGDSGRLEEVYTGLVTVLLRMVFVMFAEARGLLPVAPEAHARSEGLTDLHARLSEEQRREGRALERRFGAWARVIALFRALYGGDPAERARKARGGALFDPDEHPFLEGRSRARAETAGEAPALPRVSDGVVCCVLDRLSALSGERRSFAALDVELLGGVYEWLMGFELVMAEGDTLCDARARGRPGALSLRPGKARRRTGSHYTPRSLTGPIVETALRPIFERLGPDASSGEILNLKVCDPAMGSGAFVVEACRKLADQLVVAWQREGKLGGLPPGEDATARARRLVAQRCLYGVDKNPLAVSLARLSLWLVASAREHPFTFVDHALRRGDSLVGLSKEQIAAMSLAVRGAQGAQGAQIDVTRVAVDKAVARARAKRREIHALEDPPKNGGAAELWREADAALGSVRLLGDVVVAAFFGHRSETARKKALEEAQGQAARWLSEGTGEVDLEAAARALGSGARRVEPFHWEVEFPEVFERENGGFDCFVGNPPFLGGRNTSAVLGERYVQWLLQCHEGSNGGGDLVAHFFRRAFALTRAGGALGLVATNTIAQGDTRATGLRYICKNGGTIYEARRRYAWPGAAAVVVSLVFIERGESAREGRILDGRPVKAITASLLHAGGDEDPAPLRENEGKSYNGSVILGRGFTFDDSGPGATPTAEMDRILREDPSSAERIFPYLGGEDINQDPRQAHHRHVIDFGGLSLEQAQRWPELLRIVEQKVKPERLKRRNETARWPWWLFWRARREMYESISRLERVLVCSLVSKHLAFAWCPTNYVFSHKLGVFALVSGASFAVLQSGAHERWARAFSSTLEDRLNYAASDCFETFPFPAEHASDGALEVIGEAYYEHRAALMLKNKEGLTKTYNRFHDPGERSPEIQKLRALREVLDRAVLGAYGWADIRLEYDFHRQLDESVRLCWGEEAREEVLARLRELNRVMATRELSSRSGRRAGSGARRRL